MVKLEIWRQKRNASTAYGYTREDEYDNYSGTSSDDDGGENYVRKSIPLFDNTSTKTIKVDTSYQDDDEDEDDASSEGDENCFETATSESDEESSTDAGEYAKEWQRLQVVRTVGDPMNKYYDVDLVPRIWDTVFYISSFHNLENTAQKYFYAIKVKHRQTKYLKETNMYTPSYTLRAGQQYSLSVPIFIWHHRRMYIPYTELRNYVVRIEMWETHRLRLNSLYASKEMTFEEIIRNRSDFVMTLDMSLPATLDRSCLADETEYIMPVHKLNVVMLLEEVFDFVFVFENWWFTPSSQLPESLARCPKMLKVSVQSGMGLRWITKSTPLSGVDYWPSAGMFTFRGTVRQMKISYFVVKVYANRRNKFWKSPPILLGTCVMSLRSVKEYPLVRGIVKKLAIGTQNMQSGSIQGNIRCCIKSASLNYFEDLKYRPAQPVSGSAMLTHLDVNCQYLVIRVLRCENLPCTNTDSNTSDPMVKVKWDGIVNCTCVKESTVSPIYNQNMYFPIHLVDRRELTDPALIRYSLPIDLSSKGPVVIEVWDHDDTSSEFLGGVEIPLSRFYTNGILDEKSLMDGVYNEVASNSDYSTGSEESYLTRVYSDTLTLYGFTVPHRGSKPTVSFEMYILPPMPNELFIPDDQKKHIKSDIYRDLSRRWNKDFELWQRVYNDKFPGTIPQRRFLCTCNNNAAIKDKFPSEVIPLPYFVTPIQMSTQLSPPGELLHWISNFTAREDGFSDLGGFKNIESWQHPSRFLMTKKGGLHDRALLLCSCLLGLGYDAYVCKGTLNEGKREHAWVMTRHSDRTVSFWEAGSKKIWHLPKRWTPGNLMEGKSGLQAELDPSKLAYNYKPVQNNGEAPCLPQSFCHSEVREQSGDVADSPATIGGTSPVQGTKEKAVGRQHEVKAHTGSRVRQFKLSGRSLARYELYGNDYMADEKVTSHVIDRQDEIDYDLSSLTVKHIHTTSKAPDVSPLNPREDLLIPNKTLVYLPYSSIECVFNHKQLWGNIQNHHPSCILYDLDNGNEWKSFLKVPIEDQLLSDIQITAPHTDEVCVDTSRDILNDVSDMIELMRAKRGLSCVMSTDVQMYERLESFLDMLEFRQRLDPQFDPGMPPNLVGWSNKRKKGTLNHANVMNQEQADMISKLEETDYTSTSLNDNATNYQYPNIHPQFIKRPNEQYRPQKQSLGAIFKTPKHRAPHESDIPGGVALRRSDVKRAPRRKRTSSTSLSYWSFPYCVSPRRLRGAVRISGVGWKILGLKSGWRREARWRYLLRWRAGGMRSRDRHARVIDFEKELNLNTFCQNINVRSIGEERLPDEPFSPVFTPVSDLSTTTRQSILRENPKSYVIQYIKCSIHQRGTIGTAKAPKKGVPHKGKCRVSPCHFTEPPPTKAEVSVPEGPTNAGSTSANADVVNGDLEEMKDKNNCGGGNTIAMPFYPSSRLTRLHGKFSRLKKCLFGKKLEIPSAHTVPRFATDMCQILPISEGSSSGINYNIPYEFKLHESNQTSKWYWYYNMEAMQYGWCKRYLPIPCNHTFIGLPIHLSTSDTNEIRNLLTCTKRFKKLIVNDVDKSIYVIYAKVYPLLGGVLSTWIFIGCHIPWKL